MRTLVLLALVAVASAGMAYREHRKDAILGGILCAICEPLVEECEDLGIEYSDAYLKKAIEEQCASLGFLKQVCIDGMDEVVVKLDEYIKQKYSPEICCTNVGLC